MSKDMFKTLIVLAHPNLAQSRINQAWAKALSEMDYVTVHDIYQSYPDFKIDIAAEQRLLEQNDQIILQFPFQWYNCPALLKQWLDDVLADGWAYGTGGNALVDKTMSIAVSTWSKAKEYQEDGRYNYSMKQLTSPFEVTAKRVGMQYKAGFFLNGIGDVTDIELNQSIEQYKNHISSHSVY